MGCNGGLMDYAFTYWEKNQAELEQDYPYTGKDSNCESDSSKGVVEVTSYQDIEANEFALKQAVGSVGPISVAVDAEPWMFYGGGIFNERCGE